MLHASRFCCDRQVTEQYVQTALTDLLKVTIDLPAWEAGQKKNKQSPPQAPSSSSSSEKKKQQRPAAAATAQTTTGKQLQVLTSPATASAPEATPAAAENEKNGPTSPSTPRGNGNCGAADQKMGEEGRAGAEGEENPPDTGLWRLLYKGAFVPFPVTSFGTDLALKGSRIANSKRARMSTHTVKL